MSSGRPRPGGSADGAGGRDDRAVTGERQLAAAGRRDELSHRLAGVRARIAAACAAAGREPAEVTLVAVTKTFPASDVRLLYGLGVHDVGENAIVASAGVVAKANGAMASTIIEAIIPNITNRTRRIHEFRLSLVIKFR